MILIWTRLGLIMKNEKKTALFTTVSIGALMLASGAQAADLARPVYKAPIAPPPAWTWTGFYVGGTLGGVVGHDSITNDPASNALLLNTPISTNAAGVIGGLEAGYNWQVSQIVLGIEADVSWSSLKQSGTATDFFGLTDTFSSRLDALSTVRGRLGWAFDRTLLYATGGVAFADLKDQLIEPAFTIAPSSSVTGWTVGGGVEYALTDHWTAKAEYLHVGFGNRTATVALAPYVFAMDYRDRLDIGRVGINYKF
jgi:outer membrane immunogenic protein